MSEFLKPAGRARVDYNLTVQGLRGMLALMVLVYHVGNSHLPTFPVLQSQAAQFALSSLQSAVEVFFCISGYVIAGSLQRSPSPAVFLAHRAWRILPLLWITVTVAFVMEIAGNRPETAGLRPALLGVVYLANLAALPGLLPVRVLHDGAWSISYELVFYLLCACAWQSNRGRILAIVMGPGLIACYPRALFFIAGLMVASGRFTPSLLEKLSRYPVLCLLVFFAAWQTVRSLCGGLFASGMLGWRSDERLFLTPLAFVALLAAFGGLARGRGLLGSWLRTAPLQRLGHISFSFYLWQFPLMGAVKKAMIVFGIDQTLGEYSQVFFLTVSLAVTTGVACLSQYWIEDRLTHALRAHRIFRPTQGAEATA